MRRRLRPILVICLSVTGFTPAIVQAAAQPAAASSIKVEVEQGRLSLDVRDAPLVHVMRALPQQSGIAIKLHGELTDRITDSFTDMALEEGIRRLLRGKSFAFTYAPSANQAQPSSLIEVLVMAPSPVEPAKTVEKPSSASERGESLQRIRALSARKDAEAISELSKLMASDPSPSARSQAAAALGRLKNREALAPLTNALADQSPAVRIAAMQAIKSIEDIEAVRYLRPQLVNDPDPTVRRQALRLLSDLQSPEVPRLLQGAVTVYDASVRQEAEQAIKRWERRFGAQRQR
jgi:hypothetical protein